MYFSAHQRLSGALNVVLEVSPVAFAGADDPSPSSGMFGIKEILRLFFQPAGLSGARNPSLWRQLFGLLSRGPPAATGRRRSTGQHGRCYPRCSRGFRAKCLQLRRETLPARPLELTDAEKDLVSVILYLFLGLSLIRLLLPERVSYSVR